MIAYSVSPPSSHLTGGGSRLDLSDPYAFPLEEGEDVLLQSSVAYKNLSQPGTLSLTTKRLVLCRLSSPEPSVSIPFYEIANHFVSSAKSTQVMLKIMTDEDEKAQNESAGEIEDAKKRSRKKKIFGSIFEFTPGGPAASERDGFRDLIAQFVPLHRKMKMAEEMERLEKGKEKEKTENHVMGQQPHSKEDKEKEKEKEDERTAAPVMNGFSQPAAKRRRLNTYVTSILCIYLPNCFLYLSSCFSSPEMWRWMTGEGQSLSTRRSSARRF